jgi:hypothetical protein
VLLNPDYHTQNNFLENYPPNFGTRPLKGFASPNFGRKMLKNICLKGRLKPTRAGQHISGRSCWNELAVRSILNCSYEVANKKPNIRAVRSIKVIFRPIRVNMNVMFHILGTNNGVDFCSGIRK